MAEHLARNIILRTSDVEIFDECIHTLSVPEKRALEFEMNTEDRSTIEEPHIVTVRTPVTTIAIPIPSFPRISASPEAEVSGCGPDLLIIGIKMLIHHRRRPCMIIAVEPNGCGLRRIVTKKVGQAPTVCHAMASDLVLPPSRFSFYQDLPAARPYRLPVTISAVIIRSAWRLFVRYSLRTVPQVRRKEVVLDCSPHPRHAHQSARGI